MTAVVGQFVTTIRLAIANDRDVTTTIANFFSFFTILSNALTAIVLLIGAGYAFTRAADPEWYNLVRACAVSPASIRRALAGPMPHACA